MKNFINSIQCTKRRNCHPCRTNAKWRKALEAPDVCPYGVTEDNLPERNSALPEKELKEPTILNLVENFSGSLTKWITHKLPIVTKEDFQIRLDRCRTCPLKMWDETARMGLGKCNHSKCGCTKFKLWMATERCPIDNWPDILPK